MAVDATEADVVVEVSDKETTREITSRIKMEPMSLTSTTMMTLRAITLKEEIGVEVVDAAEEGVEAKRKTMVTLRQVRTISRIREKAAVVEEVATISEPANFATTR